MNIKRVTEIEDFANEFNLRLKEAYDSFEKKETEPSEEMGRTQKSSFSTRRNKKLSNTLFEEHETWKPNKTVGRYFEKFNKLNPKHDMNSWEILRVNHMVKRSYAKPPEFICKRDVYPTHAVGTYFDNHAKSNERLMTLGSLGKSIIDKFVYQNKSKEKRMIETDKDVWDYRHSKPPIDYNKWKSSNHIITEFSVAPADQIHSFKVEKKKKFLIQDPYRIPKKDGDYLDPVFKIL